MPKPTAKKRTRRSLVKPVRHDGFLVHQREDPSALPIFVFAATAEQVFRWARIVPTKERRGAAQRGYSDVHAKSIRSYISASGRNVIPTTVTLSLPSSSFHVDEWVIDDAKLAPRTSFASLTIVAKKAGDTPGLVIDGQHRLKALEDHPDIPVLCAVILGADQIEHALHFLIINNKAKRVSQDLVKGIINEMTPAQQTTFQQRVASVHLTLGSANNGLRRLRTEDDSPFRDIIDWDINRDIQSRVVKPNALENCLRLLQNKLDLDLDLDASVEVLKAIWNGVREGSTDPWTPSPPKFLEKSPFIALTEYITRALAQDHQDGKDITEVDYITNRAKEIFDQVPRDFWTTPWNPKSLDTSAGRELILDALAKVRAAANHGVNKPLLKAKNFFKDVSDDD